MLGTPARSPRWKVSCLKLAMRIIPDLLVQPPTIVGIGRQRTSQDRTEKKITRSTSYELVCKVSPRIYFRGRPRLLKGVQYSQREEDPGIFFTIPTFEGARISFTHMLGRSRIFCLSLNMYPHEYVSKNMFFLHLRGFTNISFFKL